VDCNSQSTPCFLPSTLVFISRFLILPLGSKNVSYERSPLCQKSLCSLAYNIISLPVLFALSFSSLPGFLVSLYYGFPLSVLKSLSFPFFPPGPFQTFSVLHKLPFLFTIHFSFLVYRFSRDLMNPPKKSHFPVAKLDVSAALCRLALECPPFLNISYSTSHFV